ncbi:MAG: hypothetical protein GX136_01300 [Clostridiales bacterium]|nr:hypothetical protein [Clostridiales bacterium]
MYIYNLKAVAKKLEIDYAEVTSHISHMGELGASREELLRDYIKNYLPEKFKVGRGIILDSDGHQSRQQDFIIYDAFNSPAALLMDGLQVLPIESVYCTIEIKSTLNKTELAKCVENIKSVRMLKPCVIHNLPIQPAITNKSLGFVFAYTSDTSIETLLDNFYELNKNVELDHQISLVCVLDKGLILRTNNSMIGQISYVPAPNTTLGFCKNPLETNFYLFYLFLMNALNSMTNLPPDLMTYAEKQGALSIKTIYPNKYVSESGTYNFGNVTLTGAFIKQFPDLMKKSTQFQNGAMNKDELLDFLLSDISTVANTINNGNTNNLLFGDESKGINLNKILSLYIKKSKGIPLTVEEIALYNQQSDAIYGMYITMCPPKDDNGQPV